MMTSKLSASNCQQRLEHEATAKAKVTGAVKKLSKLQVNPII